MERVFIQIMRKSLFRITWQIFLLVTTSPLYLLGWCIPKSSDIWIFGNRYGTKDNAYYLFEYVRDVHPEIQVFWIDKGRKKGNAKARHLHCWSLKALWVQFRARVAFVTTGFNDLANFTLGRTKVIQLWHGIPIKRILLDSDETLPLGNIPVVAPLLQRLFRCYLRRYSVVIASSDQVGKRLSSSFGLPGERVFVTGYPRQDIILETSRSYDKTILYAPTWRDDLSAARDIVCQICNPEFLAKLAECGYVLKLSLHPLNRDLLEILDASAQVEVVDEKEDINYILARCSMLITDYSSIALDFLILQRKILFFTPDRDDYMSGRGLNEEFRELICQHGMLTSDAVLRAILAADEQKEILQISRFYAFADTCCRSRIVARLRQAYGPQLLRGD